MPTEDVLNFTELLAPIEGESAVGADLRGDHSPASVYHALKDAASAARRAERQAQNDDEGGAPKPDWRAILEKAPGLIAAKSKDMEVASWILEALVRERNFPGLRDGLRLYRELVENYWDQGLHPRPDEDGIATRVASLAGLNGEDREGVLVGAIARIPVTAGSAGEFGLAVFNHAVSLESVADEAERQRRIDHGVIPRSIFDQAARETSAAFYALLLEDLDACADEYEKLCAALESRCGKDAPPSSNIRNVLGECRSLARRLAEPALGASGESQGREEENAVGGVAPPAVSGKMKSREQAFATLLEVARFFRATEPHSPLPYQLEQAVRWGRMSLRDLLTELIGDESTRSQLFQRVGIPEPEGGS